VTNLSEHNQDMCKTLDPDLTAVLDDAAADVGFHIIQTLRTMAEQVANLAKGVSQTRDSLHLPDARGLARAADLAALVNGKIAWKPETLYYTIAEAVRKAAIKRGVNVRWGGCWRLLNTIPQGTTCAQAVADYAQERRMLKQTPFFDFGHFEKR
jgi:peptidoglycan L-alanyl-D-glutamate endopeptidase CwlK